MLSDAAYDRILWVHYTFNAMVCGHSSLVNKFPSLTLIIFKTLLVKALPVVIVLELAASLY